MTYEPTISYDSDGYASVTPAGQAKGVQRIWVPNAYNGGGTYSGDYPYRLCYHEIQGGTSVESIRNHQYPPHIWYDPEHRILYQTIPLGRAALALYHYSGQWPETNKARCIQVELGGYSDYIANEPLSWLNNIAEDVLIPVGTWVAQQGGELKMNKLPSPWRVGGSAYETAPQRLSADEWANYDGVLTHANVPQNDHWDTGAMDIWWISEHASMLIGGLLEEAKIPPTPEVKNMPDVVFKDSQGSYYGCYSSGYIRYITGAELIVYRDVLKKQVFDFDANDVNLLVNNRLINR